MTDKLEVVLENCWVVDSSGEAPTSQRLCRWCRHSSPGEHRADCPCAALSLALQQRDALAAYVRAEKRNMIMQGAFRLANKPDKARVKQRLAEATLALEASLVKLHELGIEAMIR